MLQNTMRSTNIASLSQKHITTRTVVSGCQSGRVEPWVLWMRSNLLHHTIPEQQLLYIQTITLTCPQILLARSPNSHMCCSCLLSVPPALFRERGYNRYVRREKILRRLLVPGRVVYLLRTHRKNT